LKNAKELVKEFKKEYRKKAKEIRQQKKNNDKKMFLRKLPERIMVKILWK